MFRESYGKAISEGTPLALLSERRAFQTLTPLRQKSAAPTSSCSSIPHPPTSSCFHLLLQTSYKFCSSKSDPSLSRLPFCVSEPNSTLTPPTNIQILLIVYLERPETHQQRFSKWSINKFVIPYRSLGCSTLLKRLLQDSSLSSPPPNYPPPAHLDAGPYHPPQSPGPNHSLDYYSQNNQQSYTQQQYGPPVPYNQGYGPPQQYYGPQQQQGMYYGPQPGYQGAPPGGYYANNRGHGGGGSAAEGICAGLLGALACCCCIDFLF